MESSLPSLCMVLLIAAALATEVASADGAGLMRADRAYWKGSLSMADATPNEGGFTTGDINSQGHLARHMPKSTQGDLTRRMVTSRPKAMLHPACDPPAERKLVINSHVKYVKALDHLVASLKEHKFPLTKTVVFRGGAVTNSGPRIGPDGMTFVDVTVDSFDLNAFAGLSRYNNHSLVCADMYFYIHDSTQIGPCFPKVFDVIKVAPTEVITPGKGYFSNQCVFGRSVVDKFGEDFDGHVDKGGQIQIEAGGCSGTACFITHYAGKQTVIQERVGLGDVDIYHTSEPRIATWYQAWDLYKFFLYQGSSKFRTDLTLAKLDQKGTDSPDLNPYEWAPSCPRKCTLEGGNSPLCP